MEVCYAKEKSYDDDDVSEGWTISNLEQVIITLESGSRPKGGVRGIKEGIVSIGAEHLNSDGGFKFNNIKFVPERFFEKMSQGHIRIGDVLVVKDGATTGKVSLVRPEFPYKKSVVNEHVFICRPANGIDPTFLFYFLLSNKGQNRILEHFQGAAQGGINQNFASGTVIPIAPSAEQRRIIEKLEIILNPIKLARERLTKVPVILKRFRQAVLAAACSGRLTADWREKQKDLEPASSVLERILRERRLEWEKNQIAEFRARGINPKNQNWKARYKEQISSNSENLPELPETWGWATIDQLAAAEANAITDGPFGSNLKTSHYTSSGPRVIRLQNIGEGVFINESAHISAEHYEALAKHCVNAGDLVVAALGAKLPRACIIPAFVGPAIVKADCIRFKPDQGLSIAHYLNYALNEESGRHRTASVVHGVARPRLNLAEIKAIAVPLPPLAEQHEIVRRVEALFGLADAIEGKVVAATARADRLTQAVLAKAFRGELVPTEAELARREGREYEPATVLLERIREDKARLAKTKPIRRILKKPASK